MSRTIDFDDGFESSSPATSSPLPASDVSNVPSGNLSSTNQQAVNNELQSDINTRALSSDLSAHITDPTDAHAASAITNTPSGNLAATTVQGALNELQTDVDTRATSSALASHEADTTAIHGIADTSLLVTTTGAQVLTNKDFDGGTASNSSRITLPKAAKATLDGLTRKEATLVYASDTDKLYYDDGAILKLVGSGAGGETNFITDGDAEGANVISQYNDSSTTRPVDGTGGTATNLASSISSSSPLIGTNSFLLSKTGSASTRGMGWTVPFTIDSAYKAKVLQIEFDYLINSGTFVAGTISAESDVIVYIYDVTNSQLIEPSSIKLLSNSTSISDKFVANFQTSATGTSYRLIFHCQSASTSNYELKVDAITVKPSRYVFGTPITDWVSWTPTSTWVSGATHTGLKRRVGGDGEYKIKLAITEAVTAANLVVNLPSGEVIDTNRVLDTSANTNWNYGQVTMLDTGSATYVGGISYNNTTSLQIRALDAAGAHVKDVGAVTASVPATWASPDVISIDFKVPIAGWSAALQMSDGYDGRQIGFRANNSDTALSGTPTKIVWTNTDKDDVAGYSSGTYTVRSAGWYDVGASLYVSGTPAVDGTSTIDIYRNGAAVKSHVHRYKVASATTTSISVGDSFYFNSGDTIEIYAAIDITTPSISSSTTRNIFSIVKRGSAQTISTTEEVSAGYTTASANSISSGAQTIIDFGTKEYDTHNAVTTGAAWKFTVPIAGRYRVSCYVMLDTQSFAVDDKVSLSIFKNGAEVKSLKYNELQASVTTYVDAGGTSTLNLVAGDYIDLRVFQNSGGARTLITNAVFNYVNIEKVK